MTGLDAEPLTTKREAVRDSVLVTIIAWLVALLMTAGLAFAVAQRLGEAVDALKDAILRSGGATSVAYQATVIAPPAPNVATGAPLKDAEGRTVVPPRWIDVPSPSYPISADGDLVSGTVVLICLVSTEGRPETCQVASEDPAGNGFGEAALEAAGRARLSPRMVDGVPTAGQIRFVIRFTPQPRRVN
jgi:TonB family protein